MAAVERQSRSLLGVAHSRVNASQRCLDVDIGWSIRRDGRVEPSHQVLLDRVRLQPAFHAFRLFVGAFSGEETRDRFPIGNVRRAALVWGRGVAHHTLSTHFGLRTLMRIMNRRVEYTGTLRLRTASVPALANTSPTPPWTNAIY